MILTSSKHLSFATTVSVIAFAMLSQALVVSHGHFHERALLIVITSMGLVALGVYRSSVNADIRLHSVLVWGVVFYSSLMHFFIKPSVYHQTSLDPYYTLSFVLLVLVLGYLKEVISNKDNSSSTFFWLRRYLLWSLGVAQGIWLLEASPSPSIDVWTLHQQAAEQLLRGVSPYQLGALSVVETSSRMATVQSYLYPPLSLVMTTLAYFFTHETRYAQLFGLALGSILLAKTARNGNLDSAVWPDLILILLLFQPIALFVLDKAWTEMLALPWLFGLALAIRAKKRITAAILLGLLCSVKQYCILYFFILMWLPLFRKRDWAVTLLAAACPFLPFVLTDGASQLWKSLIVFLAHAPFRPDALTISAFALTLGISIPSMVSIVGAVIPMILIIWVKRTDQNLFLICVLSFTGFFLFAKQAFCNYYYLVSVTLLVAVALAHHDEVENGVTPATDVPRPH